jgi:signal transduction histidine kinase/ActR/RegA family two-component response regulator
MISGCDAQGFALHLSGVLPGRADQQRTAEILHRSSETQREPLCNAAVGREAVRARAAQAERLQTLGRLASGIVHDINNVLQAVAGATTLIEYHSDDAVAIARSRSILADATERGAAITRRLLAFARVDPPRAEPLDPHVLLTNLREILAHTMGGAIEVRLGALDAVPAVLADRAQLETVLVNLAANARDAMPHGGVIILSSVVRETGVREAGMREAGMREAGMREAGPGKDVSQPALTPGVFVGLSVTDTGCGMDAATLDRVTEPFYTTKPVGQGTGLGLSMAQAFAEQAGGTLTIESRLGQGTKVSLWLPQSAERPSGPRVSASVSEAVAATDALPRVLLVDDDALVCEAMQDVLLDAGFQVIAAPSGEAAMVLVEAGEPFDILVTDQSMLDIDGWHLIAAVQDRRPGLPAVLLTGFVEGLTDPFGGDVSRGRVSVMRKPVSAAVLAQRIVALVAGTWANNGADDG